MSHDPPGVCFSRVSRRLLVVRGPIEECDLDQLRRQLSRLIDANRITTVNLTGVTYLPAAAIGVIASTRGLARRTSRRLDVRARSGSEADRLLSLAGMSYRRTPIDLEVSADQSAGRVLSFGRARHVRGLPSS